MFLFCFVFLFFSFLAHCAVLLGLRVHLFNLFAKQKVALTRGQSLMMKALQSKKKKSISATIRKTSPDYAPPPPIYIAANQAVFAINLFAVPPIRKMDAGSSLVSM
jgi:hypothetical protein